MHELPTFELVRDRPLPVLDGHLREYRHVSGAKMIHVAVPDPSLTVSVSFRTPPISDQGHPHVLEHLVLLGSRHHPSPRAFAEVQRWTLLDYFNASTTRDWTAFTASSRSPDDLWSTLDYVLDAVFQPLLTDAMFRQEAWRITAEGRVSGVIYNEMAGALTHPSRRMREAVGAALFPGTPYRYQAGGTPAGLLQLDLEAVRSFHAEHYVPANAVFYLYGDAPVAELAARIQAVIAGWPPGQPQPAPQPCLAGLPGLTVTHPQSVQTLLAWALPPQIPADELQALNVLALALLGHKDAPLCRAMRALGGELADATGFHADTAQPVFAAGCRAAVSPAQLTTVIRTVLAEPLGDHDVQAALGRYALSALDTQHNGFPYGVQLSFDVLGAQHHGHDPYPLNLGGALDQLRAHADLSGWLQRLTQVYLLTNSHWSVIQMRQASDPLPGVPQASAGHPGDPSAPPTLESAAAERRAPVRSRALGAPSSGAPLRCVTVQGVQVQVGVVPGPLTQASLSRAISDLSEARRQALPAYLAALPLSSLGRRLTRQLQALGAQWSVNADTTHDPDDPQRVSATVTLNLKGLAATFPAALRVVAGCWLQTPLAGPGLSAGLLARADHLDAGVAHSAPQYAMVQAALGVNPGLRWREMVDGLSAHALLRTAAGLSDLGERLDELHGVLWQQSGLQALIVGEAQPSRLAQLLAPLLDTLRPVAPGHALNWLADWAPDTACRALPGTAAYAVATVPYGHPDAALLTVLGCLLHERLYTPVRAQGGAYGVTARSLPEAGLLLMVSARDPRPQQTRALFETAQQLLEPLSERDLQAARVAAFRQTSPLRSRAMLTRQDALDARTGYTPALRQAYLQRLLGTSRRDLRRAAEWLAQPAQPPPGSVVGLVASPVIGAVTGQRRVPGGVEA